MNKQHLNLPDDEEEYDQEQQMQDQNLPQYGEVEGETIKLGGLDYSLLAKQSENKNQALLSKIKDKINIISGNVFTRQQTTSITKQPPKSAPWLKAAKADSKLLAKLQKIITGNQKNQEIIPRKKVNKIKYYQYDLDPEFGHKYPTVLQKRIGRVQNQEIYVNFDHNFFEEYKNIERNSKIEQDNKISYQNNFANEMQEEDSDDIFGPQQKAVPSQINIQIGKQLSFGLGDNQDIFQTNKDKREKSMYRQEEFQKPQKLETDKYFFMPKKQKKATTNAQQDDYGECYEQTGPSLKQLVTMKKQGIQYFGDQKQFAQKEKRKPNIHKDYQKIQKIIEQKNKK